MIFPFIYRFATKNLPDSSKSRPIQAKHWTQTCSEGSPAIKKQHFCMVPRLDFIRITYGGQIRVLWFSWFLEVFWWFLVSFYGTHCETLLKQAFCYFQASSGRSNQNTDRRPARTARQRSKNSIFVGFPGRISSVSGLGGQFGGFSWFFMIVLDFSWFFLIFPWFPWFCLDFPLLSFL